MNPFIPTVVQELLAKPVAFYKEHQTEVAGKSAPLTNIAFILDCSGSMSHGKEATIEGFNAQVQVIRQGAKDAGATTFTDVHFNSEVNLKTVAGDLDHLAALNNASYQPAGNTALLDAIGATVAALLTTKDIHASDTATLVTTFTDGQENASRIYSAAMVRDMVQRLEATGRWTFALVGPQQTVAGLADLLSVRSSNVSGYDETSVADKSLAFKRVAEANEKVMYKRKGGAKQFADLYDSEDPVK